MQPRIAILVLNYNTPAMTDGLASYLNSDLHYAAKDVYVIDNGSQTPPASTTHRLGENLGFTRGMHEAWRIASAAGSYDAFWFLNSDIGFEHGDDVLANLADVLFSSAEFAEISPQFNSPHRFMEHARCAAERVPYVEATATLIKTATLERLGFWDLDLTHGWGVDYDYGYRVRQAGLANILTDRARIVHKEHQSIGDFSAYVERASSEMHTVLTRKYGAGWERINRMRRIVPVVLMCDRDAAVTSRFVESFQQVRGGLEKPLVVIDVSASPKLQPEFLASVAALEPGSIFIHPRQPGVSLYDSVQDAAEFALATALQETGDDTDCLFLEDDVLFSSRFLERLSGTQVDERCGFVTFYQPGQGFGRAEIDPDRFYGTQCVLIPRPALDLLVRERAVRDARFPPGYDIRWSRYLAANGFKLYTAGDSYVQHISNHSRLHGEGTHMSECFVP